MKRYSQQFSLQILIAALFLVFVVLTSSFRAVASEVVVIPLIGTQKSSINPSDVIELTTTSIAPNNTEDLMKISTSGGNQGIYTVPAGKYLVIKSLTIFPLTPGLGTVSVRLIQNSNARKSWAVLNSQPTQLSFGPGMLIAPGYSLHIQNQSGSDGSIQVSLYGYQTSQ